MKTFHRVEDVLDNAIEVHRRAERLYRQLDRRCHDKRAKLLLEYMVKHEHQMLESLQARKRNALDGVLNTYIQYTLEETPELFLNSLTPSSERLAEDDVIELGQRVDAYLVELFEAALREVADSETAAELLEDLMSLEVTERKAFTRTGNAMHDI